MKKAIYFLLSLALFTQAAMSQTAMRVAVPAGTEAFIPLVTAVYSEMGYQASFNVLPAERALAAADNGEEYGAQMGTVPDLMAKYPNLVGTKEALVDLTVQGWVKKGSSIALKTPEDLKQYKVGYIRGAKSTEALLGKLGIEGHATNSLDSLSQMLDAGRLDVAIVPSVLSNAAMGVSGTLVAPRLAGSPAYHVFNKKHAALVAKWDAVLKAMKADGRYKTLMTPKP